MDARVWKGRPLAARNGSRALLFLAVAAGGAFTLPRLDGRGEEGQQYVTDAVLAEVLAIEVPAHPTMTYEIRYFETRAAERPEEAFAALRVAQARMLAFRAYGDPAHLDAVDTLIRKASAGGGVRAALHLARHEFGLARAAAHGSPDVDGYRLFDVHWALGDDDQARRALRGTSDTLSTAYLSRRARLLDAEGLVAAARDDFRLVVRNVDAYAEPAPVRAWARVEHGNFELHSGDPAAAVRSYRSALDVVAANPAAIEGLASVAYGADRSLPSARDLYRRALRNGAHLDVMPVLADIVEEMGDRADAAAIRGEFIARARASAASERLYRRPLAFVLAESREHLGEALRLVRADLAERHDPGAWEALAWVLYRMGDTSGAWQHAQRAIRSRAPSPPVAFRAGIIAGAAGDRRSARKLLRQALDGAAELSPRQVREARAALGDGLVGIMLQ
ncbi:MAG: hypothetical protein FJ207_03170 [Gemmatimonadetes bacterium]|nr:hypothetical protein [Gemmatimonadota bacterium]